jgi:hypothetical protein
MLYENEEGWIKIENNTEMMWWYKMITEKIYRFLSFHNCEVMQLW